MPIQPCCAILRLNAGSNPDQLWARSTELRWASSAATKARTSARRVSAAGEAGGGANASAAIVFQFSRTVPAQYAQDDGGVQYPGKRGQERSRDCPGPSTRSTLTLPAVSS